MKWKTNNTIAVWLLLLLSILAFMPIESSQAQCLASQDIIQGNAVNILTTGNNTAHVTNYVLVDQATGLVVSTSPTGNFLTNSLNVDATYQVHTLNYDPSNPPSALTAGDNPANLSGGCFDTNFTTEYICFTVRAAACTQTLSVCPGESVTVNTTGNNTTDHTTEYYLVNTANDLIDAINTTGDFTNDVVAGNSYKIHILNYSTIDAPTRPTVGSNPASISGGCYDLNFLTEFLCVTAKTPAQCNCSETLTVCPGNPVTIATTGQNTSAGYATVYYLVNTADGLIDAYNMTGDFTANIAINNSYQIHILNYDMSNPPSAMPLGIGSDPTSITDGCYDPNFLTEYLCVVTDVAACGNSCSESLSICEGDAVSINTTGNNTATGQATVYYLVDVATGLIDGFNTIGDFTATVVGGKSYQIHILNYSLGSPPSAMPLGVGDNPVSINDGCYNVDFLSDYLCLTVNARPTTISASTTASTCSSSTPNDDASIILSGFTTQTYDYTVGTTYTGGLTTYASGTAIPGTGIIASNLADVAIATNYTIRVFNANDCYTDIVTTLLPANCGCSPITVSGDPTVCQGAVTNPFTHNGVTGGSWNITPTSAGNMSTNGVFTCDATATGTVNVTYTEPGGCTGTTSISIIKRPTAVLSGGGVTCGNTNLPDVIVTCTGTAPWTFTYTDGSTSNTVTTTTNPYIISNAMAGSYSLSSLSDGNGCAGATSTNTVMVIEYELPTATVSGGGTVCNGDPLPSVDFGFTGTGPWTLTYSNGTANTTISNITNNNYSISNASAGTYSVVSIIDLAAGCGNTASTSSATVVTENCTCPPITVSGDPSVCQGASTNPFTHNGLTGGTWSITPTSAGSIDASGVFNCAATASGNVNITYTEPGTGCTGTTVVNIKEIPTTILSGGGVACGSDLPDVLVTCTGASPWTFTYTDGSTSNTVTTTASPYIISNATAGSYSVNTLSDGNGCGNTASSNTITVVEYELPTATVSGGGTVCETDALPGVAFDFTGTGPWTMTYSDGTSNTTVNSIANSTYSINNTILGTYSVVSLTDEGTGCSNSAIASSAIVATEICCTVNVGDMPAVAFCEGSNPTSVFSLPYVGNFWDGDDTDGVFDPQFNGPYGPPPPPSQLGYYDYAYVLSNDDPGGTTGSTILYGPSTTPNFSWSTLSAGTYRLYAIAWLSTGGVTLTNLAGGSLGVGDDVEGTTLSDGSDCLDIAYTYVTILSTPVIANATAACAVDGSGGEVTLSGLAPQTYYEVTGFASTPPDGAYASDALGNLVVSGVSSGTYSSIQVTDMALGCTSNTTSVTVVCDGEIGNLVWDDVDSDATYNSGIEPGIVGLNIKLTWYGLDNVLGTPDDVVYNTTTDLLGQYLFTGLPMGQFEVEVLDAPGIQTYDAVGALDHKSQVQLAINSAISLAQNFGYQTCVTEIILDPIPDNAVCSGELIRLDVLIEEAGLPSPGVAFNWVAKDGGTTLSNGSGITSAVGTAIIEDQHFNAAATPLNLIYTVTSGCKSNSGDYVVYPNPVIELTKSDYNNYSIDCNGAATGSITADMINGSGNYNYLWSTGATTATVSNLPVGMYSVTVNDMGYGGCPAIASIPISQPTQLNCGDVLATNESCEGDANGSAEAFPTGGVAPYSFAWSTGATTNTLTGLGAGTYEVTTTDANGCDCANTVTIESDGTLGAPLLGYDLQSFEGDNGGINTYYYNTVIITVWGGFPTYIIEWEKMGYVRTSVIYQMVDSNDDNIADTEGAEITIIYDDYSEWIVNISDDNPCGDPTEVLNFSNNDLNQGVMNEILDIDSYSTTPDTGGDNGSFSLAITGGGLGCGPYDYEIYFQDGTLVESGNTTGNPTINNLASGWYTAYVYCDINNPDLDATIGWYWVEPQRRGRGKTMEATLQMYPNPFSEVTNIEFTMPQTGKVMIDVYSIDGQLVRNLFNETVNAKEQRKVPFNGGHLPSGIYLVKMITSAGDVYTQKLILNKQHPKP